MRIHNNNGTRNGPFGASPYAGQVTPTGYAQPQRPKPSQVVVLTDDMVKDMFANAIVHLNDGVVPVAGEIIGWQRTDAGCLGAIVVNKLTGARFLFGPDLSKGGRVPKLLARLA
jgi:hypothetical protein